MLNTAVPASFCILHDSWNPLVAFLAYFASSAAFSATPYLGQGWQDADKQQQALRQIAAHVFMGAARISKQAYEDCAKPTVLQLFEVCRIEVVPLGAKWLLVAVGFVLSTINPVLLDWRLTVWVMTRGILG